MAETSSPRARYTRTKDGVRIAYTIGGEGPCLIYVRALNSHAERWWTDGWTSRFMRALAQAFTVVVYDARGNGLSDDCQAVDLEGLLLDLDSVVRDAELRDITLFGQGFGTPVAIAYAARHADLVSRLLLYCAYARGSEVVITDAFIETMRSMPEAAVAYIARDTYPDDANLPTRLLTMDSMFALSPDAAVAHFEYARTVDVIGDLPHVRAPTLVMQPQRNPQVRMDLGAEVAAGIEGAVLRQIPGGSYNPYAPKSFEATLEAIADFAGVSLRVARPVVLMLTDMVDSTAMTQRVGDVVSRELHALHDSVVRSELDWHKGAVTKHTGDGIMAAFANAAPALACAVAIQRRLAERSRDAAEPVTVRVGLAQGEVYAHNDEPLASSAQLVTRVAARGGAGDILVTDRVREQARGTGVTFGAARSVSLKGFAGRVRLHEVVWDSTTV